MFGNFPPLNWLFWAGKMSRCVRVLTTNPADLISILEPTWWKQERTGSLMLSSDLHAHALGPPPHTHLMFKRTGDVD